MTYWPEFKKVPCPKCGKYVWGYRLDAPEWALGAVHVSAHNCHNGGDHAQVTPLRDLRPDALARDRAKEGK